MVTTRWWAALAVAGCLLTIAGVVWYVHALEDHARRWHPAVPLAVFTAGCLLVLAVLAGIIQWGD